VTGILCRSARLFCRYISTRSAITELQGGAEKERLAHCIPVISLFVDTFVSSGDAGEQEGLLGATNKAFFYPQSLWFLDFHNCADGHPYTRCKQRCSTSVMRTCVSIRAISMRNYLPVNTTNFSSLSHFNKTVSSAYLLSFCKVDLAWLWSGSEHVSGAERQNFRSSLSSIYGTPACRSVPVPTHALITLSQRIRSMICVRFTFLRVLCVYH